MNVLAGPGELGDAAAPPVLLLPGLSGELVAKLGGGVVASHPSFRLSHLALLTTF